MYVLVDGAIETNRKSILRTLASCEWTDLFTSSLLRWSAVIVSESCGWNKVIAQKSNWFPISDDLHGLTVDTRFNYQSLSLGLVKDCTKIAAWISNRLQCHWAMGTLNQLPCHEYHFVQKNFRGCIFKTTNLPLWNYGTSNFKSNWFFTNDNLLQFDCKCDVWLTI